MTSPYRTRPLGACPRCLTPLDRRSAGSVRIEVCVPCRGLWLANESVTGFLMASESDLDSAGLADIGRYHPEPLILVHALACPRCLRPMTREPLALARVTIDLCKAHGMWFDAGELRAFVAALRAQQRPVT